MSQKAYEPHRQGESQDFEHQHHDPYHEPSIGKPGFANTCMVLGIAGLVSFAIPFWGLILSAAAMNFGYVVLKGHRVNPDPNKGKVMVGLICGTVGLLASAIITILAVGLFAGAFE